MSCHELGGRDVVKQFTLLQYFVWKNLSQDRKIDTRTGDVTLKLSTIQVGLTWPSPPLDWPRMMRDSG